MSQQRMHICDDKTTFEEISNPESMNLNQTKCQGNSEDHSHKRKYNENVCLENTLHVPNLRSNLVILLRSPTPGTTLYSQRKRLK